MSTLPSGKTHPGTEQHILCAPLSEGWKLHGYKQPESTLICFDSDPCTQQSRILDFGLTFSSDIVANCPWREMSICPRCLLMWMLLTIYLYSWLKLIDPCLLFAILPLPYRLLWNKVCEEKSKRKYWIAIHFDFIYKTTCPCQVPLCPQQCGFLRKKLP